MLCHLSVENYVLIERLALDFTTGLTVITGETGAGKSIIVDVLSLLLGERADNNAIGNFQEKCNLTACFDLGNKKSVQNWLSTHDYGEPDQNEAIIRRVIQKEGKSRQMINGFPCTLQQLREFMQPLINVHSQNQHQFLVKKNFQRELLDEFSTKTALINTVKENFHNWQNSQKKLIDLQKLQENFVMQCESLQYQIAQFEELDLRKGEYEQLDQEHKELANAENLVTTCQEILHALSDDDKNAAQNICYRAQEQLTRIKNYSAKLSTTQELLTQAIMHLEEGITELRHYLHQIEINPQRLNFIEQRLTKIHDLSRKYHIAPAQLYTMQEQLQAQFIKLNQSKQQADSLAIITSELKNTYFSFAQELHQKRQASASKLNHFITKQIQALGMPNGEFKVDVQWNEAQTSAHGCDDIEFLVRTNPGFPLAPLNKIASGGEISRIALAIYVATAQKKTTPILIFDEVDVGIGGSTAAVVGELLKTLGNEAQILCITHSPQVATYGNQHLKVHKQINQDSAKITVQFLSAKERIQEIARMLGGTTITEKTLAHAEELIQGLN